jgi:hypothetical protein
MIACIAVAAEVLKQLRRKPTTVGNRSGFHDQVMDELKRFDEAIERSAKRRTDEAIGASLPDENSHTIPPSTVSTDRAQTEQSTG